MSSDRSQRAWSLRTTITWLLAVPFALCLVLVGTFVWSSRIAEQGYVTAQSWREHAIAVVEMRAAAETFVDTIEDAVTGVVDEVGVEQATQTLEAFRVRSLMIATKFSAEEQSEEAQLLDPLRELMRRGAAIARSHDTAALAGFRDYFRDRVAAAARERVDEELEGSIQAADQARRSNDRISRIALTTTVLLMVLGLMICIRFASKLQSGFGALSRAAGQIAAGELDVRVNVRGNRDLAQVGNAFNAMAAHLSGTMVQRSTLEAANAELVLRRSELENALTEIRRTQNDLMRTSRLAAIGEMAGRTAHEVLNPAQSLLGRLSRMSSDDVPGYYHDAEVLSAIVAAWREAYTGGAEKLLRSLAEPVGEGTALDADLAVLAELVTSQHAAARRVNDDIEFLRREIDRITRIVDGMRGLMRPSSSIAQYALATVLAEACEILRDSTNKRKIEVRWSAADDLVVELDRHELLQVLTNLMRNAMPAIEERSGYTGGCIELRAELTGGRIALEIRDDGNGIADEHLPLIFEPSFTTRGATDGTGLGLGIARRLVRQMGGDITIAHTEVGRGTTFLIDLPLAAVASDPHSTMDKHDHSDAA